MELSSPACQGDSGSHWSWGPSPQCQAWLWHLSAQLAFSHSAERTWGCPRSRQRLPCNDSSGTEGAHNCLRCHAGCAVTRGAGHSGVEPVTTVYVALAPDSCWPVSKSSWVFAGSEPHGGPGGFRLKQNLVLLRVVKVEPPAPGLSLRPRSLPWHYSCESSSEHCPRPRGLA